LLLLSLLSLTELREIFSLISGILGKRTRFQQKDISQLVLHVTTANDEKTVATVEHGHEECTLVKVQEQLLPKV